MHEVGHVLGLGWAEIELKFPGDGVEVVPKGMEVYSGDVDGKYFEPDQTPEYIDIGQPDLSPRWSVMMRGPAPDTRDFSDTASKYAEHPVLAISMEELSTISFEEIPTKNEE